MCYAERRPQNPHPGVTTESDTSVRTKVSFYGAEIVRGSDPLQSTAHAESHGDRHDDDSGVRGVDRCRAIV